MHQEIKFDHNFVESIPKDIDNGTLYVSMRFATAIHKCACGCGEQVVTPFSPTDWKLLFDGESVSLNPSIGNWSFNCRSHYWIRNGKVVWAEAWTDQKIQAARDHDRLSRQSKEKSKQNKEGLWNKIKLFLIKNLGIQRK